jgi:hypothetical protein
LDKPPPGYRHYPKRKDPMAAKQSSAEKPGRNMRLSGVKKMIKRAQEYEIPLTDSGLAGQYRPANPPPPKTR